MKPARFARGTRLLLLAAAVLGFPVAGQNLSSVTLSPTSVTGGVTSTGTVTLSANAPTGGKVVSLSSGSTGVATVPSSVTVAAGAKTKTFVVSTTPQPSDASSVITAVLSGVTKTATLAVKAPVMSAATVAPTSVTGGTGATLTVTLTGNAPAAGKVVTLSSGTPLAATVPASVTVSGGAKTATAPVTTFGVNANATVTLTATAGGIAKTASLTVSKPALTTLGISPSTIPGGGTATATLTLTGPAGPSGATVTLSSNKTNVATVPSSKLITAGQATATFTVTGTTLPAGGTATITATWSGVSKTANVTLQPSASLQAVGLAASSIRGGQTVAGTVTLSSAAPSGGVVVGLTSSFTAAATVPANVTVLQGQTTAAFAVTTSAVGTAAAVTITATASGVTKTAPLTVEPAVLTGLTISPQSIPGNTTATGTLTLDGPAGPSGATVSLSSNDTNVATVPASTLIAGGQATGTFTITGAAVTGDASTTIFATLASATHSADVTVTRPIGALTGTVKDASTGFTLPSAHVVLTTDPARETWTDGNGLYQLSDVPPGLHTVDVDYAGFTSASSSPVTVANGATAIVPPVSLAAIAGAIAGTILDQDNGNQPVGGALVTDAVGLHTATTDGNGHYELTGLAPGFTYLVISRSGYRPGATEELSVDADWTAEANVGISAVSEGDRPGLIEGVVRDAAAVPVSGATVSIVGVAGFGTTTGSDGRYSLAVPAAEAFLLEAQKPGFRRVLSRYLRASAGDRPYHVAHDFVLSSTGTTGTIELRTFDPVSRTPFRADVWFRTSAGIWHAPVSDSGVRTITGVPAGLVWGCAGPRLLPAGGTLTLRCPGEPVVPAASPRWAAAGIVMNRYSYEPVAGATATFVNGTTVIPVTTDANGLFSTHSGPVGDYSVTVTAPGYLETQPWLFTAADHQETGNFYGAWLWPEMPGGSVSVTAPVEGAVLAVSRIQLSVSFLPARPGDQLLWVRPWLSTGSVSAVTTAYAPDGMSAVVTIDGELVNGPLTIGLEAVTQSGAGITVERNLTVNLPTHPTALSVSPSTVPGGSVATGTVTVDPPAPAGGAFVYLSSSSPAVTVPPSVSIAAGETSGSFGIMATAVASQTVATITASVSSFTASATLTVNSTVAPPLRTDLVEGDLSGWQGFADPPWVANVSLETSRVKVGSSSLKLVTDSGFDCGVRYVVPGGAHWDLRGIRFLTFWSYGNGTEIYQGEQPVVVLRGPGGSIRLQPPAVQTVNGEWRFHRVPLGDTSDWIVTTEGAPSLGDVTSFEIHQDPWGMGLTVFYDGFAFGSDIPEDLAEGTAALWGTFASDNLATSVVDDSSDVRSGASALRFDTASGFDTGLVFPKPGPGQAHWNLSDVRSVTAWIRAERVEPFEGNSPVLVLRSPSGSIRYEPGDVFLNTPGWRCYEIPLDGTFPWTKTQEGTPDLSDVTAIELHSDVVGWGFRLHVDGVSVGRPLPLVTLPSATTLEGSTVMASVFLSDSAPAGGRSVLISSSDPAVASVPASVVVPQGSRSATFTVTAGSLTAGTPVSITVADRGFSAWTNLRVDPIVDVTSLALGETSVIGGTAVEGTVTIEAPAGPGGVVVLLTSSSPAAASVPAAVVVPEGAIAASFTVTTVTVASNTPVSISANAGGATATATLTVNPPAVPAPPPLATDLVEGALSGWQGFAGAPYVASTTLDTTRVRVGTSSLKFVTDSGFDCGVRYLVPGGAHWDLRGIRFLTFWSFGQNSEAYDGAQPVVIFRGPGGSIRLQPPEVQTLNGEWSLHRVPLGDTSDWIVTTEGTPSLSDITSFEIHQDTAGMGMTVFYDGVAFVSDIPEDLAEGTAALWGTFASDNLATSVVDDASDVRSGASALRFETASGFDTGLVFPKPGPGLTHWDLSDVRSVTAWIRAEHVESFQGNYPVLVLRSPSGSIRYEPGDVLLNTPGWRYYEIPLDGTFPWTRTQEGTPDLSDVTALELHGDIVEWGFRLQVDGVSVGRPLPLVRLPSASTPGGHSVTASVFLSDAAPVGGRTVLISSSDSAVASVPASVVVPEGARGVTFPVTAELVPAATSVSITVSDRGFSSWTSLRVDPVADVTSLVLGTSSTIGGLPVAGTVTIATPAWAGGAAITLTSSNPAAASIPAVIAVPAGGTAASFSVATSPVAADTPVTFSANAGAATATSSLTVVPAPPPELSAFSVTPASVLSGASARLAVSLAAPAPLGGAVVALAASPAGLVSIPSALPVAAGAATVEAILEVPASTPEATITFTATVGSSVRNTQLTVFPPAGLSAVSAYPGTVAAGGSTTVSVSLVSVAPSGGKTISLASSVPAALVIPATIAVPEGAWHASVTATAPSNAPDASVTITATDAAVQKTATVAVLPAARISALAFAGSAGLPGEYVIGTLTLTVAAPVGGYFVNLVSSLPGVISVPASVVVPEGQHSTTFQAAIAASGPGGEATVSASQNGVTKQATISSVAFAALLVTPTVAVPGVLVQLRVDLTANVPLGRVVDVALASSDPAVASVPASAQFPENTRVLFVPATRADVTADTPVEFTVTALGVTRTVTVVLEPLKVISVAPRSGHSTVDACWTEAMMITTNAGAPAGGATVQLQVENGTPSGGTLIQGSHPQTWLFDIPAGHSTLDVSTRASWTVEPRQLVTTARLGPSQVVHTMAIKAGAVAIIAFPSTVPRGSTATVRLGSPEWYSCYGGSDFDAAASSSNPEVLQVPATVHFSASDFSGYWNLDLTVPPTAPAGVARLTFSAFGTTASVDITVPQSTITGLSVSPTAAPGGAVVTGTVTLDSLAPGGGPVVLLESADPSRIIVPASVSVPAGTSSAVFPISVVGPAAGSVTVTATYLGVSRSAPLSVLSADAGRVSGRVVDESWWDYVPGMGSVVVKDASGSVLVTTAEDGSYAVWQEPGATTLTVEKTGFASRSVGPFSLSARQSVDLGVTPMEKVVTGGCRLFGRVIYPGGQPVEGAALKLVGYDLTLTTGADGGFEFVAPLLHRYRFRASKEGSATIVHDVYWAEPIGICGYPSRLELLDLTLPLADLPEVTAFWAWPPVLERGETAVLRGRISGVVPQYDVYGSWLYLSGSIKRGGYEAGPVVAVNLGGASGDFVLDPLWWIPLTNSNTSATAFTDQHAFFYGGVTKTTPITYLPAGQKAFFIACWPPSVTGRGITKCNVHLGSDLAPAGGLNVTLTSSSPLASIDSSVVIPAGQSREDFSFSGTAVSELTPVTVTATAGARVANIVVEIAPPAIANVWTTPSRIAGGGQATGNVSLDSAAPTGGVGVALSTSSAEVVVPATLTIPAGASSATFAVTVLPSAPAGLVNVRAVVSGRSRAATLDIGPPRIAALSLFPASLQAGTTASGSVNLDLPAPAGGLSLSLVSSDPAAAQVPAVLEFSTGVTHSTFTVTTSPVLTTRSVTVTASISGSSKTANLEVRVAPPTLNGAAPGVALPGTSGIVVYGTGLGVASNVLLSGPVYPIGGSTAVCNIRGTQGPFCPEVVAAATPSADGKSLTFSLPSNASTGTYLLEVKAGQIFSTNGVSFLVEEASPAFEVVTPEDHKIAQRIYPGQTIQGVLSGTAPNCPYGATDYNQYFFFGTAGSRINVRMERVDTSVPWSDPSSLDPQIEVVAPDGFIYGNLARFNDRPGVDFDATISNATLPQTGLYVILAETARGSGEYRLSFSFSSLAPAPLENRVIPVAGNHITGHVGDVITSWAQILDPRGHPLSGANTTFQRVAEPGDAGTIQFTSGASIQSSSTGTAAVSATLTSFGRVRFEPVLQQTFTAPAATEPEAPALAAMATSDESIPLYPAVAMRPFSVGRFDGQLLGVESSRFERFPLRAPAAPSGPFEEPASGARLRALDANVAPTSAPQPYGPEEEARGEVPVTRFGAPNLAAASCQDGLRFHTFAVLPSAQINAPLTVSLEDLTPSTGASTPNGPVGDEGIYGHRVEKEIRLRISVRDANGNEPDYPVLVSVFVGGWASGQIILDPDGSRIECPSATFVWHERDANGVIVALNEVVGYRLGTYSDFVGLDLTLKPVWNWTELFEVKTFTPAQEEPSLQAFGVHPEPGKPDQILCRKPSGESCGEVHKHWTGYLAHESGLKPDGSPRYFSGVHATLTAYRLVDKFENDTFGYFNTSVAETIPSTDVEFVPHVPGEVRSDQLQSYKLRVSWTNDPAWPSGSYPATLSVHYPTDPDWASGDVSKEISFSFETGLSHAISRHLSYDLIRPDGTRGVDDGSFPMRAYPKATSGFLPKTEAGDGPRLVLLAYRGEVVPGEIPVPEPTETGLRMWQPEGSHWRIAETRTSSFLETGGPSSFRFTLIDSSFNVIQDGGFVVHRCPRFDHSAPGAARPCELPPVASVNGQISSLLLNPAGPGATDSRGYLGLELTRAPEGLGIYYVMVESLSQEYRLRRQSDLMSTSAVADGEFQGAFNLVDVGDYPCPDARCGVGGCNQCTGSPNYVSTGTYTTAATDLVVPTSGPAMAVSRNYVSTPSPDGVLGPGWTSSLEARVYLAPYVSGGVRLGTEANVVLPTGIRYKFRLNPVTGHYDPPAGRNDDLVRNADGSFDLFLERGSGSVYRFDKHGRFVSETDEFGNVVSWERDAEGRLSRIVDLSGTGRSVTIGWTGAGKVHTLTDSAGRTVTYDYDADGRLTGITDPANRRSKYDYARGRYSTALLTKISDPWGRTITDVTYDEYDRTKSYTEQGTTYTYTYAASNRTTKVDDSGHSTENTFDPDSGVITSRSDPGDAFNKVFDSEGRPVQVTDAAGVLTTYTYDGEGHVLTVTRNASQTGAVRYDYAYDPAFPDKVASVTPKNPTTNVLDPAWQGWRYEYHPAGSTRPGGLKKVYRVASDGTTADSVSEYEYDGQGRVRRQMTAGGAQTDYDYDGSGNLQTVTGPAGSGARPVTTYQHDALGRVTDVTDPLGKVTHYTYDALGRVLTVTLPPTGGRTFTTTYSYDHVDVPVGLLYTEITDPNGRLTRLGYDVDGRLRRSVDAAGGATLYGYTGRLLTTITDPNGNVTNYGYDAAKRLASTTFPDGGQETYTYWNDGLLKTKTDRRGTTVTYAYDAFKRLKTKSTSTGGSVTYNYEGQKLLTVVDTTVTPAETHTFDYDTRYRIASAAQAGRGTAVYTYTVDDRVESLTLPGGVSSTWGYHADGSLQSTLWSPVSGSFTWDYTLRGQYETVTFPNGQERAYGYDDQGRLTTLSNTLGAVTLASYSYGYDVDLTGQPTLLGQRTSQMSTLPAQGLTGALTRYDYDPLYQLVRAEYPAAAPFNSEVHTWTYDGIGNRETKGVGANVQTYTYLKAAGNPLNGQRLNGDGADAFGYDAAGNVTGRQGPGGAFTFGYDPENRLKSVTGPENATYTYDYQGRRTSKTVSGVKTTYLYDGLNLVSETTGGQTTYFLNGPGIDEPLAMSKNGAVSYFSVDGLGSVVATNDPSGTVTHSVLFDAWGSVKAETGTRTHPFTYTGREVGEAGFHFYRARFYQPSVGRFSQEDPLAFSSTEGSFYAYVRSSPISLFDPFGLVDLNLVAPRNAKDEKLRQSMAKVTAPSEFFTVGAHGNPSGVFWNGQAIPAWRLAELIRKHKDYKPGMPVRLYACRTGMKEYAQQLANLLNAKVQAPTWRVGVYPDGTWELTPKTQGDIDAGRDPKQDLFSPIGRFVTFEPKGDEQ